MGEPVIEIKNLSQSFGKKKVISDLSLTIQKGEIIVILGRSGMGKSVLLGLVMGLKRPLSGEIFVEGVSITQMSEADRYKEPIFRKMGILFQGGALLDSLTVAENVAFYLDEHGDPITNRKLTEKEIEDRVKKALSLVGLDGSQSLLTSELSGGMRKRAALARLIAYDPNYIFYDEPTSELDLVTSQQISQLIAKTNKELGATSIVVSHDMHLALSIGDRLAMLENGKITHLAPPKEFMEIDDPTINSLREAMEVLRRKPLE